MAILGPDGREIPVLPGTELRYNQAHQKLLEMCDFQVSSARPKNVLVSLQLELELIRAEFQAFLLICFNTKEAQLAYNNAVVACMEESVRSMGMKVGAIQQHLEALMNGKQETGQETTGATQETPPS